MCPRFSTSSTCHFLHGASSGCRIEGQARGSGELYPWNIPQPMTDESWWRNAPSFATGLLGSWISPFLLRDFGQATSPLWASFPICKMRMMRAHTSSALVKMKSFQSTQCARNSDPHMVISYIWGVHACLVVSGLQSSRLLCPWDFPAKNTGVGCCFLLQGIFPTQDSNLGLLHCKQVLYHLSHQGNPRSHKLCGKKNQGGSSCAEQYHNWAHAPDDWHHSSSYIVAFSLKLTWIHWNRKVKWKKKK